MGLRHCRWSAFRVTPIAARMLVVVVGFRAAGKTRMVNELKKSKTCAFDHVMDADDFYGTDLRVLEVDSSAAMFRAFVPNMRKFCDAHAQENVILFGQFIDSDHYSIPAGADAYLFLDVPCAVAAERNLTRQLKAWHDNSHELFELLTRKGSRGCLQYLNESLSPHVLAYDAQHLWEAAAELGSFKLITPEQLKTWATTPNATVADLPSNLQPLRRAFKRPRTDQ